MLHLKQTLHNLTRRFLQLSTDQDRFAVTWKKKKKKKKLSVSGELGILLYCPMFYVSIVLVNGSDLIPSLLSY